MPSFIPVLLPILKKVLINFIVSMIANKIFGKKSAKGRGAGAGSSTQILINKSGNNEPIPLTYGRQRIGGTRAFIDTSNGAGDLTETDTLNICLILGEGEMGDIQKLYFNDTVIWDTAASGTGNNLASGGYELQNYAETKFGSTYITYYRGTTTQTVDTTFQTSVGASTWDNNRKLSGLAYLVLKLPFDDDYNGAAPEITVECIGHTIRNLSIDGGGTGHIGAGGASGAAAADQNPAEVLLDYLTNSTYGKGIAGARIDVQSFAEAAAYFDGTIGSPAAKRFVINGFLDTGTKMFDNIEEILAACNGILTYTNGKYKLRARQQSEASVFSFNTGNIIGAFDIAVPPKTAKFNKVEMTFNNIATKFNDDIKIVNNATYLSEDNATVLLGKQDLTLVSGAVQAENIATWMMNNSRYQTTISFECTHTAIDVEAGDIIDITHAVVGYSAKKFRVQEIVLTQDDTIKITAQEYTSSIQI